MLDTQVADFKRDGEKKINNKLPRRTGDGTQQNAEAKKLQEDIKAFLISILALGFHSMKLITCIVFPELKWSIQNSLSQASWQEPESKGNGWRTFVSGCPTPRGPFLIERHAKQIILILKPVFTFHPSLAHSTASAFGRQWWNLWRSITRCSESLLSRSLA